MVLLMGIFVSFGILFLVGVGLLVDIIILVHRIVHPSRVITIHIIHWSTLQRLSVFFAEMGDLLLLLLLLRVGLLRRLLLRRVLRLLLLLRILVWLLLGVLLVRSIIEMARLVNLSCRPRHILVQVLLVSHLLELVLLLVVHLLTKVAKRIIDRITVAMSGRSGAEHVVGASIVLLLNGRQLLEVSSMICDCIKMV